MSTRSSPAKKRKKSERYDDPIPVKLDKPTGRVVRDLKKMSSFQVSEILRRAVRYAAPKFLSGEVNMSEVSELAG